MSELSRALGTPETITHKGKSYQLSALEVDVICAFEQWLMEKACEKAERLKHKYGQPWLDKQISQIVQDAAGGAYDFFSEAGDKARRSIDGVKKLAYLRMKRCNSSISEDDVEEILTDRINEVIAKMNAMDNDPNPKRPAGTPGNSDGSIASESSATNPSTTDLGKSAS